MRHVLIAALALAAAPVAADPLMKGLVAECGRSFEGRVVTEDPADRDFAESRLVMHVRGCDDNEVRIPFHVGENRSRTWIITRTNTGYRLKHQHLKEDGSPDLLTNYGGDSLRAPAPLEGGGQRIEFPADQESKELFELEGIPQSMANVWAIEHVPGRLYVYELKRPNRHLRVEFDLTRPVATPPAPWGG
jgi:hypothetical protein